MILRKIGWTFLAPALALMMVAVTAVPAYLLLDGRVAIDAQGGPADPSALLAITVVPFAFLLAALLAWIRFVEKRGPEALGLVGQGWMRKYLRGYALGVAALLGVVGITWLVGGYSATVPGTAWASPHDLVFIVVLVFGFVLQSSVEELLIRGWLLGVLSRKVNVPVAVVVSSVVFASMHFSPGWHWLDMLALVLFSFFACAWRFRSGDVLGVMGWHSGWNWILAVGFGLPLSGIVVGIPSLVVNLVPQGERWLHGGPQGPESSIACILYYLAATALLMQSGLKK